MTLEIEKLLDETGWRLLQELQENARLSYSELGQRVGLSSPAVADRVRRMEEAGVISGYHAEVDMSRIGLPVQAIIRLRSGAGRSCQRIAVWASDVPEVIECYRVSGDDSVVVKVAASSVTHLENVVNQLSQYGYTSTSIIFSNPMKRRTITHNIVERGSIEADTIFQTEPIEAD
jgi:Lrp/AsnC family transcriptional regulator, leucine-responsive regulatory protein